MKIAVIVDDFYPYHAGGSGMIAYSLAQGFRERGDDVLVVTAAEKKEQSGDRLEEGLRVIRLADINFARRFATYFVLYNKRATRKLHTILSEFKPDIVHVHTVHNAFSYHALHVAKHTGAKVFLTAHDTSEFHPGKMYEFIHSHIAIPSEKPVYRISTMNEIRRMKWHYNPLRNYLIRKYLEKIDGVIAVSEALADALRDNGISSTKVITNGIDTDEWNVSDEKRREFEGRFGLAGKLPIFFGGRISRPKGAYVLFDAFQQVVKKFPQAVLLIVGPEKSAQGLKKQALKLGLGDFVIVTGWLDTETMKAAYATSRVVAVPSVYLDPFPTINLEAMAMKKAVVGTCFGGTPEIVVDGRTGYIVNPYNTEMLAERLSELLADENKCEMFGEEGYKRVKESFSRREMIDKYEEFYRK